MNASTRKQIAALRYVIELAKEDRRRNYAAGEHAYQLGVRVDKFSGDGIEGQNFGFAEDGHRNYVLVSEHIKQLEDLVEIVNDPGVVWDEQLSLWMPRQ